MRQFRQTLGDVLFSSLSLYFNTVGSVCLSCGTDRTRTYELRREEIYSLRQLPLCDDPKIRKGEDGSVDISFYDWHYYDDSKLQMYHLHHQVNIHSFPNQPIYLAHPPRLELGTTVLETGMIPFHHRCLLFQQPR